MAKIKMNSNWSALSVGSSSSIWESKILVNYSTKFKLVLGTVNYKGCPISSPSSPS